MRASVRICAGCHRWMRKDCPTVYCRSCEELREILFAFVGRIKGQFDMGEESNIYLAPDLVLAINEIWNWHMKRMISRKEESR